VRARNVRAAGFNRRIIMKRAAYVTALGLFVLALAAPASAQRAIPRGPEYAGAERQSYFDARRAAFDNGYREGIQLGERDGRRNAAFQYQNERTYQRADRGYHRSYGDRERYRQAFRSGYSAGYRDGYERYARAQRGPAGRWGYPGSGSGAGYGYPGRVAHPAAQAGFDDGYEKGIEDARKNRSFDVLRHKWYREGDRHYENRYGSREQYKNIYRDAFRSGYDRGFREAAYRDGGYYR
jgi:hypothetical protein